MISLHRFYSLALILLSLSISTFPLHAQIHNDSACCSTIDNTLNRLLEMVSREKDSDLDSLAFRDLFIPSVRFTVRMPDTYERAYESLDLDDFVELLKDDYYAAGFTEVSLGRDIQEFNGVAQVFEAFEYKDSEGQSGRGMNSIQLIFFENRWHIANVLWVGESTEHTLPTAILEKE